MKSLIWKEWRENLKWTVPAILLMLAPTALFGAFELMDVGTLFYVSILAAVFGATLGFLQVFFEAQGDRRSLLLHRPLSRSQIFLAKIVAGVGLYLLAVGIPLVWSVGLAATPGHVHQPFGWPMVLPWVADVLTGLVYYFAGMLTAQWEARWYGSKCLGLAAGLCCSLIVWTVPEFRHAIVAIVLLGGVVAAAAWGSFSAGGAYAPQPRSAKIALGVTFLAGLLAISFTVKVFLGAWLGWKTEYQSFLDHQGRVLRVAIEDGRIQNVTDLAGEAPPELQGRRLIKHDLDEVRAVSVDAAIPRSRSYRNLHRFLVEYNDETKPGIEAWWYVPAEGRLVGYDKKTKHLIGSFGPDGFVRPEEQPRERFQGELAHLSVFYYSGTRDYLVFPGGVYAVDFRALTVRRLFAPEAGETILWASKWKDPKQELTLAFVGTDRAIHVLDKAGSRVLSLPLAYDRQTYRMRSVGRLEKPERYWVWYESQWYLEVNPAGKTVSDYVLMYDSAGREIEPRQKVPPRPGSSRDVRPTMVLIEPSETQAVSGLVTPMAEAAVLRGTTRYLESEVRDNHGAEVPLLLRFLLFATQFFLPGVRWAPSEHPELVVSFATLMLLSAGACALVCLLLARRSSFGRARCLGWSLCGLLWGPMGLLLMLAVQEWPARIPCSGCRKPRVVTRETCEHCGAAHALPAADGTEIFEQPAASPDAVLAGG